MSDEEQTPETDVEALRDWNAAVFSFRVGDHVSLVLRDGTREAGVITEIGPNSISISRKANHGSP